jgi:glutamate/tyrosine decarboxylase-like PLP-dependent enzyme
VINPEVRVVSREWEELERLRVLGHRMVDRLIDHHRGLASSRVFRQPVKQAPRALPIDGIGVEAAFETFIHGVEPYATGNAHPRFFGWAMGAGTTFGALAQLLAGELHANAFGGAQSATLVEAELLAWLKTILHQPESASGLLTSGASLANLYALYVAREKLPGRRRVFASEQVHVSVDRACRMLDLELVKSIDADERALAIVGTAGTVLDGTMEDLTELADRAQSVSAWFHVDAAIGIGAALTPRLQASLQGLERADSVAFDLHKWLQISPGTGGLLVRDAKAHETAFRSPTPYLGAIRGGLGGSDLWFHRLGLEHTRRFLALEPWLVLLAYGTERLREIVERGLDLAQRFKDLVDAQPELERLAEVPLNIVLFRHRSTDRINERLIAELQQRGIAVLSPARVGETFAMRAAFFGHRTKDEDLEGTIAKTIELGAQLSAGSR